MFLNYIWIFFFLISFLIVIVKMFFFGDYNVVSDVVGATFDMAKSGFEISLGLTGVMTLWLGLMKIGERGGIVQYLSRAVSPFFKKLFPEIPDNHPVYGSMMLNFSANMLGLDNAATPLGLKAMEQLQELNKQKDRATNAMIMFLVINTSGLTLIPITILAYRTQLGALSPTDVFIPLLITTFISTIFGILLVSMRQRINIFNRIFLLYLGGLIVFIGGLVFYMSTLPKDEMLQYSKIASNLILLTVIVAFITLGLVKKINVYDAFIDGAKDGFNIAIKIIPFLVAMLVAIGVFRASGAMDYLLYGLEYVFSIFGFDTQFVAALPTAIMKPLSGSGARGMMLESMNQYGADSFVGRLSCIFQGATETTFYIIAVYFGSVGIKNVRYAAGYGLLVDLVGVIAAIFVAYLFFS